MASWMAASTQSAGDPSAANTRGANSETMKGWVGDLGETSETPLLEWVQKYVGKMKIDNLTGATVLTLIDKRVEKYLEDNIG